MYKILTVFLSSTALICTACGAEKPETSIVNDNDTAKVSVETKTPNTSYKPAFPGQTRIAAVKTQAGYEGKAISSSLKKPWGITSLPDGRLLITEKGGTMKIATASGTLSEAITGILPVNSAGQGGLLGITLDPAFTQNRMIYWTFSEDVSGGTLTSVAKGKLSSDDKSIENAEVIYRATPSYKGNLHYGSRIVFDQNGNLIVSTGERSDMATRPQAQALNSALGKVLRITTEGKPAAGNPFLSNSEAKPEIYAYGNRNVQGLAIHPVTGDIWENEYGPRGGDEINIIQAGKNYGWPTITYGIEYDGKTIGGGITQKDGMEQPVYYWDPVVSPSGMSFYTGDSMPEWKNNLFIGALSAKHLLRLVLDGNKVVGEERLLESEGQRFRDVTSGKDGALYAITDEGRLYRVAKK